MLSHMFYVKELYFQQQVLAHIVSKPTFGTLQKMLLQLKADTSYILWTLDCRAHSFVGVIPSIIHTSVTLMTPFLIPIYTNTFTVPMRSTQYEIVLQNTLMTSRWTYFICTKDIINGVYLVRLLKRTMSQVPMNIRVILLWMFQAFGKIIQKTYVDVMIPQQN